jgi:hypothetical protein
MPAGRSKSRRQHEIRYTGQAQDHRNSKAFAIRAAGKLDQKDKHIDPDNAMGCQGIVFRRIGIPNRNHSWGSHQGIQVVAISVFPIARFNFGPVDQTVFSKEHFVHEFNVLGFFIACNSLSYKLYQCLGIKRCTRF